MEGHHRTTVAIDAGDRFPQWSVHETRRRIIEWEKEQRVVIASDDEDDNEESDRDKAGSRKKKGKVHKSGNSPSSGGNISILKETLEEFMKQQMQIEMEWLKAYKAKEEDRRLREMEWRQTMEALESERIVMERGWRQRDEQRRMIEEARAENRDALISALLNKLRREDM
ncbi:hypothetical protein Acr_03g0005580 [Actinidia rufa]|uniref:Uncharacterized protein n=1 Tax=Actinidia rufa TaxID=165716 RepID=A0A7J0EBA6_9ERIC|nr:hypothetical protein Acr_03g0005580 [Actinidia rufa]